jgi:hypothetical protein
VFGIGGAAERGEIDGKVLGALWEECGELGGSGGGSVWERSVIRCLDDGVGEGLMGRCLGR